MNPKRLLQIAAVCFIVALLVVGCALTRTSITDRIIGFQADLNKSDRSSMYLNFHPDSTADYNAIKTSAFWVNYFPVVGAGEAAYAITNVDPAVQNAVTATINGPASFGKPVPIVFKMAESSDGFFTDFMIEELTLNGIVIVQ